MSICIAFADALPLLYLIIFMLSKIPCETSRCFGGHMSTSIAFADDLSRLPHNIQLFQHPVRDVSHSRMTYVDLLSHLRMTCFHFTSCSSPFAVSYRSVHGIQVSTRRKVAVFAPIAISTLVSYRCVRGIWTSSRRTALCALFLRNVFSPTPNATSNANNRHLSRFSAAARDERIVREVSIICMTSLPFASCYSCFLLFSPVR